MGSFVVIPRTVDQSEAALQPIAGVDANHQAGLVVKRSVFSRDAAFEREIPSNRQKEKVAIIGYVVIESLPPEIRLGFCGYHKGFAGLFRGGGLVKPFHFGEKRFS